MQDPIKPIPTPDQKFHDGNPATGELGTIVSADWLNNVQSALQATQQEVLSVLKDTGQNSDPARQDQLLQAVKKIAWGGNSKPTTLAGYGITDGLTLRPQLGDRVDLNNITDDGLYHNPANAYAVNGANYPVPYAGLLFAFSDGEMVYQQYQSFNNAGCWYRCRYRGNWTQWQKLADAATTLAGYGITDGATKAELKAAVDGLVSGAPGALNTLQELAAALGNDQNFAATITNKLAGKADKSSSLAGYGINTLALSTAQTSQIFKTTPNVYDNNLYTNGTLELRSTGTDFPALGLHRPGNSAVALVHKSYGDDTLVLKEATGSEYRVWHSGNDSQIIKKRRYRVHADDGTSLDTSISAGEMGFNYGTSSGVNGPFIAFGGLGGSIDYSCQLTADYGSGTTMRFRTRNDDAKRWNPWHTLIHEGHLTGQVAFFAMTTPPDGWLPANGTAVNRSTFASLFAAIGTTYGTGDGTTTFNLPDLRGEFVRGWDANVDQGRIFGSKQKGSLVIHNDDQDTYAGGIINNMTNKAVRDVAGYDFVPDVKDYTSGLVINNVALLNQQSISQVFGSNPQNWMYMTRPRNIALLPCIKY
ncbi:tail fiber protein [Chromobacterium amazonense]|uniref:Tail fiber protein n=1 Tax=Chromobacterium amazonense TaxID=1382803 RepID=A0ABU8V149_9NEIS|nr:tail fiber protein [Chromobacterium amazonense]MDQ4541663.1 tail fiber protein [Chromobacterium amazonense]